MNDVRYHDKTNCLYRKKGMFPIQNFSPYPRSNIFLKPSKKSSLCHFTLFSLSKISYTVRAGWYMCLPWRQYFPFFSLHHISNQYNLCKVCRYRYRTMSNNIFPGLWIRIDIMRIRIQHFSTCGSGSRSEYASGSSSGSRVSMLKNWTKLQLEFFNIFFWSKIAIYLSLGLHKGRPC